MADVPLQLGPWEPDRAPHMSPALTEAVNVLRVAGAYTPMPSILEETGVTLPSAARALFSVPLPNNTPLIYAATTTKIYRIDPGSTVQVYDAGSIAPDYWSFAQFAGRTIAVNLYVNPQGALPTAPFAALGGTPPRAKVCAVVDGNFLVLGNLQNDGIDGYQPNRIRWSGFGNPDTWGTSVGTQADFNQMPDEGGSVVAITGGETGTVFQRKMITRMQYVGLPNVFTFTTVERARGAVSAGAVCSVGDLVFFYSDDGFYVWNGVNATPIGTGRVDDWFRSRLDHSRLDAIISGFDPVTRCVFWGFPELASSTIQTMIVFSLGDQQWTSVSMPIEVIAASASLPRTLESMPTPDTFGGSFDDPAFAGGVPILAGIDSSHTYGAFTGSNLASTITTGDFQVAPGARAIISSVRPIIDSPNVKVSLGLKNQTTADTPAWTPAVPINVMGIAPMRANARFVSYRMETPANDSWTRATGMEIGAKGGGWR